MHVTFIQNEAPLDTYEVAEPAILRLEDCKSLQLPPGLELSVENARQWFTRTDTGKDHSLVLEVGLPAKVLEDASDGSDSDDTTVGSSVGCDTSSSASANLDSSESSSFPLFTPETLEIGTQHFSEHRSLLVHPVDCAKDLFAKAPTLSNFMAIPTW